MPSRAKLPPAIRNSIVARRLRCVEPAEFYEWAKFTRASYRVRYLFTLFCDDCSVEHRAEMTKLNRCLRALRTRDLPADSLVERVETE